MGKSRSEEYLFQLAGRSFLKLWVQPNAFYAPGKELTDLIVPFGQDVILISDKACDFDFDDEVHLAWSRWFRGAIAEAVRPLKTAMQRIRRDPRRVFGDAKARQPMPTGLVDKGELRFHLVAVVRPDQNPEQVPPSWPGLRYVSDPSAPLEVGPIAVGDTVVHVFDGPTIDLLLQTLDTAPDFLAYLKGRAHQLKSSDDYDFAEADLLGASMTNWDLETGILPSVPKLESVVAGLWEMFAGSERAARLRQENERSRTIDSYIEQEHAEYIGDRFLYERPTFSAHEQALRLLAAESRFARRIIAYELYDILSEDTATFWVATVPSPTDPRLRYLWLTYPARPPGTSDAEADQVWQRLLQDHVFIAQALFSEPLMLGIASKSNRW